MLEGRRQKAIMKGLYLYCLREKTEGSCPIVTKGINGKGRVFTVPYNELEAVVSDVSWEEFNSEEVQRKAREDLSWIKEKCIAHERVIEKAMQRNDRLLSVIPMRFGTIFKGKARLEENLEKDYPKIKKVLERIRHKQEWGVKVYLKDKKRFEQMIKEKNEAIKQKEKEIASLPEGIAFFMEEEIGEIIAQETKKELNSTVNGLFEKFAKKSAASVKNRILEKELTGKDEPMVLNAAYLVSKEKIDSFKREIEKVKKQMNGTGFYLEYSGPWPAFNFTSYQHNG
jgi:hypothetical protein